MSSSVSPASATAARHASTASANGSTISRRPIAERPTPESTTRCSKRSLVTGGRVTGRAGSLTAVDGVGGAGRLEQWEPHVFVLLEPHLHFLADVHLVRVAADDVRREVHRRVLGERDVRDRVRRLEAGQPLVLIHRDARRRCRARTRPSAPTSGCGTPGRSGPAGGSACGTRCNPGCVSWPSAPDVQNHLFIGVSCGRGRTA